MIETKAERWFTTSLAMITPWKQFKHRPGHNHRAVATLKVLCLIPTMILGALIAAIVVWFLPEAE